MRQTRTPTWKRIVYGLLIVLLAAEAVVLAAVWQRGRNKSADQVDTTHGTERLITLKVGGVHQYFLIRGQLLVNKPVILYVHRGPGAPLLPDARWIGARTGLEQEALMVYWEPRGAGKSRTPEMLQVNPTVDDFTNNICDLAAHFKTEFDRRGVVLMGANFGGYLSLKASQRCPEHLLGTAVINPWWKGAAAESLAGSARSRAKWTIGHQLWWLATSPEYDWREAWDLVRRGNPTRERMETAIKSMDLLQELGEKPLTIPILLAQSIEEAKRTEAEQQFASLKADDKSMIWIDNAGSDAILDAPELVGQAVKTRLEIWLKPPKLAPSPEELKKMSAGAP
jgi:pimeloyl-ACP methyl ester carboxylesterase